MTKNKKEIDNEYYHANKAKRRAQQNTNYQRKKELTEKQRKEMEHSLYNAESIKVLMSWREYTELSKEKKKSWADFVWTLEDIVKNINFADVTQLQKLELLAGNLIRDYRYIGKVASKIKSDWKVLTEKEQNKLVKYWALEKVRREKALVDKIEEFVKQGESYEKEIELAKFHEERGKVKCECWQCQEQKKIRSELKVEQRKEEPKEKIECGECGKFVSLSSWNEEAGACKKCVKRLNG